MSKTEHKLFLVMLQAQSAALCVLTGSPTLRGTQAYMHSSVCICFACFPCDDTSCDGCRCPVGLGHSLCRQAARALEDVRLRNRASAEENLHLARSIEEARGLLNIVRSSDYASIQALFKSLHSRQEAVMAKMGPTIMLARLREEADKVRT